MASLAPLRIAELLTSRFCHDLITPIGAINTGLELFEETPLTHGNDSRDILDLILHSAQAASARLCFYRQAFGSSSTMISFGDARHLIEQYYTRTKMEFQWQDPFQPELLLNACGRILFNAVLWLAECAPRGGKLHIIYGASKGSPKEDTPEDAPTLLLRLKADGIILHQGTLEALKGQATLSELTPRTIPCHLIHCLVQENKQDLSVHRTPSELFLEIRVM